MSKTIYKYPFHPGADELLIRSDYPLSFLTIQIQRGIPCVWALVDQNEYVKRKIGYTYRAVLYGTGWELDDQMLGTSNYVGTIQEDCWVWHCFVKDVSKDMAPNGIMYKDVDIDDNYDSDWGFLDQDDDEPTEGFII